MRAPQQQLTSIGSKGYSTQGNVVISADWLPKAVLESGRPVQIMVTAGASCPDALVEQVVLKIAQLFGVQDRLTPQLAAFDAMLAASPV